MIPGLPQVGGMELFIVLVVILLFFGASRVPELARSLGKGKREFQKGVEEANAEAEKPQPGMPRPRARGAGRSGHPSADKPPVPYTEPIPRRACLLCN